MNEGEQAALLESLHLSADTLARVAHRTQQWGEAAMRKAGERASEQAAEDEDPARQRRRLRASEGETREAASLLAIAGSYWLLLDRGRAGNALRGAAQLFTFLESGFAQPLAVCGHDEELLTRVAALDDSPGSPSDRSNALLAIGWLDTRPRPLFAERDEFIAEGGQARQLLHRHLDLAYSEAESPVGRLRVPLASVARVVYAADAVAHEGPDHLDELSAGLHDALLRIDDTTQAAMADRYHWRELMSSVLPVEPEAAALGAIAMAATMRHEADQEVMGRLDLPPSALAPLRVGRMIARQER